MGEPLATNIDTIRDLMESAGATLITKEYVNNHSPIEFLCSNCGAPGKITWKHYSRGQNHTFLCHTCALERNKCVLRKLKQGTTIDFIREEFEKNGATLISTEYVNDRTPIEFNCACCGKPWHIVWGMYKAGKNQTLYCYSCNQKRMGKNHWDLLELKQFFLENGSELYSEEYYSADQKLEYKCIHCGDLAVYSLNQLLQRKGNRKFFCEACVHGYRLNPNGNYGGENKRHLYDLQWFKYIYKFFNLTKEEQDIYSAHHVNRFDVFPDYRTSFCNGFPIKMEYHDLGAVDPETGLGNPFHVVDGYLCTLDYPDYVKLPYHTYSDFQFLDLNSKLVTEIIAPKEDMDINYLLDKVKYFQERGLVYVPFFFDELFVERRLAVVCSFVRRFLYKWFPDIYRYTGQDFLVVDSEIYCDFVSKDQAKLFLRENNLNGFIVAEFYVGVFYNDLLVGLLSFENKVGEIKILGWNERLNTIVDAGFSTALSFIKNGFDPVSISYKVDYRFAIYDYGCLHLQERMVLNKFYVNKETNRYFKEMKYRELCLNKKLLDGGSVDRSLEREENFVVVYDLGDLVYVWEKDKCNN